MTHCLNRTGCQGHAIRFATVDLAGSTSEIRERLLRIVEFPISTY